MYRKYGDTTTNWAVLGANTLLEREKNINPHFKWEYEDGLTMNGLFSIYSITQDARYFDYIKSNLDHFVKNDGVIQGYNYDEFNLDHINNGKWILDVYEEELRNGDKQGAKKYKIAADTLFNQLLNQPRLNDGTFWHKQIYPYQCWLDGLYMGSVFYARYMSIFGGGQDKKGAKGSGQHKLSGTFDDVCLQFTNAYNTTVDKQTGLCKHIYDEARQQPWADKKTGKSPHYWLRAIGWFVMGMVDSLEYIPQNVRARKTVIKNLNSLLTSLIDNADKKTGLWFQIVDQGDRIGNYLESSGSFMLIAALAKSIRLGYVSGEPFTSVLNKAWENAIEQFLTVKYFGADINSEQNTEWVNVNKMCQMAGLGGQFPGRDGSFAYYIETPIVSNDHKGYGPFLLAAAEMNGNE